MSAQNKFIEREKKFNQCRKCGNVIQHKQNTFALTQPQMPRKNVKKKKKFYLYENLQNGGHRNFGKNI